MDDVQRTDKPVSYRFDAETVELIRVVAEHLSQANEVRVSQADAIRIAIRELARAHGIIDEKRTAPGPAKTRR